MDKDNDNLENPENNDKYLVINEYSDSILDKSDELDDKNKDLINFSDKKVEKFKKEWEDLNINQELINKLKKVGFKKPSKIQQMVCKVALKHNVVSQSQNGSGKTLSFLVPIINDIDVKNNNLDNNVYSPQTIILADTRALITQIRNIINLIDKNIGVECWYSGVNEINNSPILISTFEQLKKRFLNKSISATNIRRFVVDECDKVLEYDSARNFIPVFILKNLNKNAKIIFTSATMPAYIKTIIQKLTNKLNFVNIELKREELTLKNVLQLYLNLNGKQEHFKFQCIENIIKKIKSDNILIFMNTKKNLGNLLQFLIQNNHKAEKVTSGELQDKVMETEQNEAKIKSFLAGKFRILLTTNLLSRGIDMRKVNLVINAEMPMNYTKYKQSIKEIDFETYLHRVGRTGRFGDYGISLNIILNNEEKILIKQIEEFYKHEIKELNINNLENINENLSKINTFNQEKREILEENI